MKLLHLRNAWLMDGWALLQAPPGVRFVLGRVLGVAWPSEQNWACPPNLPSCSAPVLGGLGSVLSVAPAQESPHPAPTPPGPPSSCLKNKQLLCFFTEQSLEV